MANSLEDLQNLSLVEIKHNWRENSKIDFANVSRIIEYLGTSTMLEVPSNNIQNIFEILVTNSSKNQEYDLLNLFNENKGRLKRFWIPDIYNRFKLIDQIYANTTTILVGYSKHLFFVGERIYIQLKDGSKITRKITNFEKNGETTMLTVATPFVENILIDDVEIFTKLLLARFDIDSLEISYKHNEVSEAPLRFLELRGEYDELQ